MKKFVLLSVLLLLPLQALLAQQEPAAKEADKPAAKEADKPKNLDLSPKNAKLKTGTIQLLHYWFADADKWMEYAVYVPKSFNPAEKDKKYPTIFALHGLGHSAKGILLYPGFKELAEKHGYILIAPSGHGPAGCMAVGDTRYRAPVQRILVS